MIATSRAPRTAADVNRQLTLAATLFQADTQELLPKLEAVSRLPSDAWSDGYGEIVGAIRAVRDEGRDPVNHVTVGRLLHGDRSLLFNLVTNPDNAMRMDMAELEAETFLNEAEARGIEIPETVNGKPAKQVPTAKLLSSLVRCEPGDSSELIRHRFLCRNGILLLCGPTGIGKSSLAMQCMILWAVGREAFGMQPPGPIKSLLIQSENDEGDLAEMRDGVIAGLNLTPAQAAKACESVIVRHEDQRSGTRFFLEAVKPLLTEHRSDLLWIDPALAYLGGVNSKQEDVGFFLRNQLNPLLREFNCGCVVVHHTNKPPSGREKPDWSGGDFAYLGAGSAEWANAPRAILALRSIGSHDVFELRAAKRGGRLGWFEPDGETKSFARFIAHAKKPGVICWREASKDEAGQGGRPKTYDPAEMLDLLPAEGLTTGEWQKLAKTDCGISEATFHRERRAFEKAGRILKSKISSKWQPIKKA